MTTTGPGRRPTGLHQRGTCHSWLPRGLAVWSSFLTTSPHPLPADCSPICPPDRKLPESRNPLLWSTLSRASGTSQSRCPTRSPEGGQGRGSADLGHRQRGSCRVPGPGLRQGSSMSALTLHQQFSRTREWLPAGQQSVRRRPLCRWHHSLPFSPGAGQKPTATAVGHSEPTGLTPAPSRAPPGGFLGRGGTRHAFFLWQNISYLFLRSIFLNFVLLVVKVAQTETCCFNHTYLRSGWL